MRHINDALDTFFVYWVPDLIEHQAQENRKGKRDEQVHQADDQRVSQDAHEAGAGQKAFEILEPDELFLLFYLYHHLIFLVYLDLIFVKYH